MKRRRYVSGKFSSYRKANQLYSSPLTFQTYEEASTDATPPYWQTTVIAPAGMGDMVLVEGMPVGNVFAFAWNMISKLFFFSHIVSYLANQSPIFTYLGTVCHSLHEFPVCRLYVVLPTSHFTCRKGEFESIILRMRVQVVNGSTNCQISLAWCKSRSWNFIGSVWILH